ncbi:DUF2933 domain-containing protein [Bradyrhizobium sp. CCBAU 51753]|uniref:DUF2933 domain-containing protein n=1 Tax=Bradyrhizobium sp. CCBAU 51753 TaxID=1325100 RepID=UPI00188BA8C1|nr:DUF2933 domain-containing protein [Bradyrhizobium sp. CCBAU 51753]QOZ28487.1 hypothetical protein XH93_36505 [Bradyrhizobium sp. CCBAU 51753]
MSRSFVVALVIAVTAAIVGALLFTQHQAHVIGVLLWLPLLACPLMHFFMHGKHRRSELHHD